MLSKKEAVLQAPGAGSLLLLISVLSMGGGFSVDGSAAGDVLEPRIINLEENVSQTQIQLASLQTDIKHYEKLMETQTIQNDKIYDLLLQLCQGMASTTSYTCYT